MATLMEDYFEAVRQIDEVNCENYVNFEEICEYECLNTAGMYECIERIPYSDDEQDEEKFNPEEYMECAENRSSRR